MKCFIFLFLTLTIASSSTFAQTEQIVMPPSGHFVYLFDGTLLLKGEYSHREGFLQNGRFFDSHGNVIKRRDIKFYRDNSGYYANLSDENEPTYDFFAKQLHAGTFDVFSSVEHDINGDMSGQYNRTSTKYYYYAKGLGKVKKVTYDNVKLDLSVFPNADFPEQEELVLSRLDAGKKQVNKRWTRLGYGMGIFIAGGLISYAGQRKNMVDSDDYSKLERIGLGVATVGLGVGISALLTRKPEKFYIDAIRAYNKTY